MTEVLCKILGDGRAEPAGNDFPSLGRLWPSLTIFLLGSPFFFFLQSFTKRKKKKHLLTLCICTMSKNIFIFYQKLQNIDISEQPIYIYIYMKYCWTDGQSQWRFLWWLRWCWKRLCIRSWRSCWKTEPEVVDQRERKKIKRSNSFHFLFFPFKTIHHFVYTIKREKNLTHKTNPTHNININTADCSIIFYYFLIDFIYIKESNIYQKSHQVNIGKYSMFIDVIFTGG